MSEKIENETWEKKFINKILTGDSSKLLSEIPDEKINLVITSPPYYQQRDYGGFPNEIGNEKKVDDYIKNLLKVFHECVRITRKDGSIIFNIGDKYINGSLLMVPYRFALEALKNEPIKLINIITWVKLNPTPRQYKRRLVSSTEPFFHFVKSEGYYYDINSFMKVADIKSVLSKRATNHLGKRYFDLIEISNLSPEEKKNAKEELEKTIQQVKEGKIAGFRMKIRGIHSMPFGGQEGGRKTQIIKKGFTIIKIHGDELKRDVIECPVETLKGIKHPAIYPEFIIQELIKLTTRFGDIVLDPFCGSGTTCIAAKKLGRRFIGIDINPRYCKYAEERIKTITQINTLKRFI
jgi:site-specific DNA-methyltransferase (adenine-specific)